MRGSPAPIAHKHSTTTCTRMTVGAGGGLEAALKAVTAVVCGDELVGRRTTEHDVKSKGYLHGGVSVQVIANRVVQRIILLCENTCFSDVLCTLPSTFSAIFGTFSQRHSKLYRSASARTRLS